MTLDTVLRRGAKLVRFATPNPLTAWRLHCIRRSGLFDREFYLGVNPGLHAIYRAFPERHYLLFGEAAGLRPSARFSAEAYLAQNTDLAGLRAPFVHYARHGHRERRIAYDRTVDPAGPGERPPPLHREHPPGSRFAAVVHVFYPDLWDEIAEALDACGVPLDLHVTVAARGEASRALAERIGRERPGARVVLMPNRGRDLGPFVHLLNCGLLDPYEAVLKLHTKRSPHRDDGDAWRRDLISGLVEPGRTAARLEAFLADDDAAFWTADGQVYDDPFWWGVNEARTTALLRRIEIEADPGALRFPAGSMYWVKPLTLRMVRGLNLRPEEFEIERAQLDGTLAHALERAMGFVADACGQRIRQAGELDAAGPTPAAPAPPRPAFVSAVYDPGFRRVPGEGTPAWSAVARARALFEGHAQPALPSALGLYDLARPDVMGEQAALARAAGVDAFCVLHRTGAPTPLTALLARPEIDFPFHLCATDDAPREPERLAADVAPLLRDPRHVRPDGRRLRLIFRHPRALSDVEAVARLRGALRREGLDEVEIGAALADGEPAPGVDFRVEWPPHGLLDPREAAGPAMALPEEFAGAVHDHAALVARATDPERADALPPDTIAAALTAWDETAARGLDARLTWGAHPGAFRIWLRGLSRHRLHRSYRGEVLIHAWNAWGERAALEPSERWGEAWLEVLAEWRGAGRPAAETARGARAAEAVAAR